MKNYFSLFLPKRDMKHSLFSRMRVQILHELGHSIRVIAEETGKPKSFVERWIRRPEVGRHPGTGQHAKITRGTMNHIYKRMAMKRRKSLRVIGQQMHISRTKVQTIAKKMGLFPYRTQKKPLLTSKMISDRFKFAKEHLNHDWSKSVFIDEKKVTLVQLPNRKNDVIWAPKGEVIPFVETVKFPIALNVCAGISVTGRSEIFVFEENMNSQLFLKILRQTIIPFGKDLHGSKWELIMDNDPKHTSKKVKEFLHENQVTCPKIPARSPDMNPLENVWAMLDDELKKLCHNTKDSLRRAIISAWTKIDQEKIKNAIESMPQRLLLIKNAKGLHTHY